MRPSALTLTLTLPFELKTGTRLFLPLPWGTLTPILVLVRPFVFELGLTRTGQTDGQTTSALRPAIRTAAE